MSRRCSPPILPAKASLVICRVRPGLLTLRLQSFDGAFPEMNSSGRSAVVVAAYSSGAVAEFHRLPGQPHTLVPGRRSILVANEEYVKNFQARSNRTQAARRHLLLRAGFQLPQRIRIDYNPYLPL